MSSMPILIIHGATAFTAVHLLEYLEDHPDASKFNLILAGRNKDKLDKVNGRMKTKREVVVCDLGRAPEVRELVKKGSVVVNLAGPFRSHGAEALIRECALSGKHYVDITGESYWLGKEIIPRYDYLASKTGSCIVPACGFDSVPSDLTVYSALRTLQSAYPGATITHSTSFFKLRGSLSGGTLDTMRTFAEMPANQRGVGEWGLTGFRGPKSPPRGSYTLRHFSFARPLVGSFFFMFPFNRCIVRRSFVLSKYSPRAILDKDEDDNEPRHGEEMVYEEAMQLGSKWQVCMVNGLLLAFGILFYGSSFTRRLVTLFLPKPGQGVAREKLEKGYSDITNVSETTVPGVTVVTKCKGVGDPGYLNTCHLLAESALSLVLSPPESTNLPALGRQGGVLTASTGLGMVLLERLNKSGKMTWKSEIAEDPDFKS